MLYDLLLAAAHHLLLFGLIAMLVAEAALLRGPVDAAVIRRLGRIDIGYGVSAALLLAVGLARVFQGIKGAEFYLHNPWFHAKLGVFLLIAALSILPTLRFLRWRKALRADPAFRPADSDIAGLRLWVRAQLALLAVVFVLAAAMARFGGF